MKTPGGLSNNLLGKIVTPKYMDGPTPLIGPWPKEFKANLSGEYIAEIVATWTQGGIVRIAMIDPFGTTGETALINVNMVVR